MDALPISVLDWNGSRNKCTIAGSRDLNERLPSGRECGLSNVRNWISRRKHAGARGLDEALAGADVLVDVANSPSLVRRYLEATGDARGVPAVTLPAALAIATIHALPHEESVR